MALTKISASVIAANAIVAAGVAENSISTSEIATDGVGTLQISDGAVTSGKLDTNIDIAGTLDVTGVLTADSNVVIAGNLTVNGATVTNSSTNTTIADALIELGTGTTGSPANDAGIVIERGDSDNAFIGWDESADTFILGTGSFTGASTGNLTISTAPLSVGTLTASGITFPTSDGSSGQVLKTDGSGNLTFDAQTAVVDNFTATGDGSTTDFDTGINPGDEVNTWVFIDGVYQQKGEYSYSGSTISFSTAPDSGATIDVTTGTVGGFASADSVLGVYETTTTNTDTYTTGISASNENNTWVFVGGVYQPKDSYTFSSGTLTFDANTPTGQKLSVTATKSLSAGSVETNTITANAVTSAKIASNSILSRHIANNSIVGADISATTQITASTFTGALTGDVTGNVVGNLTGTIQTAAQTNITSVGTLSALTVSGQLTAGGLSYPTSDGTNEQVLRTDGSGNLSFGTVSGTTINNNTNNYVMTGTGTANTLNGESGLTFDGSTLSVTGTVIANGLTVDTNTLYVDSTNNRIGIGTTSPAYQVEIENTGSNALLVLDRTDGAACFIEGQATRSAFGSVGATPLALAYNSAAVVEIGANGAITVNPDGANPFTFPTSDGSANQVLQTDGSGNLSFSTASGTTINNNADNRIITGSGTANTLEGESTLTYSTGALSVTGSGNTSISINTGNNSGDNSVINFGDTADADVGFINYDHGTNKMQFSANSVYAGTAYPQLEVGNSANTTSGATLQVTNYGNIGVGRTPQYYGSNKYFDLLAEANGAVVMALIGSNGSGGKLNLVGGTDRCQILTESAHDLHIGTNSTTRLLLKSNNSVVVVNRSDSFGAANSAGLIVGNGSDATMQVTGPNTSGFALVNFYNGGLNGIGSIKNSNNNAVTYNTTSDYRLKENVDYTWDATTRLKQLKPARFNWISDETNTLVDGFLAHEVSSIVPESINGTKDEIETHTNCVLNSEGNWIEENVTEAEWQAGKIEVLWTEDDLEDDKLPEGVAIGDVKIQRKYDENTTWVASHTQPVYQTIDHSKLVPLLTKALQEQQTIIDDLKSRIEALEE